MKMTLLIVCLVLATCSAADAAVKTKSVDYEHDGVKLRGHFAWDDAVSGKRPGILVVHEWWGLNDYARRRAEQLAELGYVAFALDMYGEGKVTEHPTQAREWATQIRSSTDSWQKRALAGLEILKQNELVDTERLAAIGYCFGGSTVLQLAFSGADVDAVVSFHGALPNVSVEQAKKSKASILICHGAEDPFIPEEQAAKFRQVLGEADLDWQMIYYGNARHSFTSREADERGIDGMKYNKKADERSWASMQRLFEEVIPKEK